MADYREDWMVNKEMRWVGQALRGFSHQISSFSTPISPRDYISQLSIRFRQQNFQEMSEVDTWLVLNIERFSDIDLMNAMTLYYESGFKGYKLDSSVATVLLAEIRERLLRNPRVNFRLIDKATLLNDAFQAVKVDLSPLLQECCKLHISAASFPTLSLRETMQILAPLSRVRSSDPNLIFLSQEGKDVLQLAESAFSPQIANINQENAYDWCDLLCTAATGNWGSREFIEKLERSLFAKMDFLSKREIMQLITSYLARKEPNLSYLREVFYKPLVKAISEKSRTWRPLSVVDILSSLLSNRTMPLYCDSTLTSCLQERISDSKWVTSFTPLEPVLLSCQILRFLAIAGEFSHSSTFAVIGEYLRKEGGRLQPHEEIRSAVHMAQIGFADEAYWQNVLNRTDLFLSHPLARNYMYSLLLNLRIKNKPLYDSFLALDSIKSQLSALEELRKAALKSSAERQSRGFSYYAVKRFLTSQQIPFTEQLYNDYYIDFALPERKIAVDLRALNDFVIPGMKLKGMHLTKKATLEANGWTYRFIPTPRSSDSSFLRNVLVRSP